MTVTDAQIVCSAFALLGVLVGLVAGRMIPTSPKARQEAWREQGRAAARIKLSPFDCPFRMDIEPEAHTFWFDGFLQASGLQ